MTQEYAAGYEGKTSEELIQIIKDLRREIESCREEENKCLALTNRLYRSEARFIRLQEIAHLGYWTWDIPRDLVEWSDEVYRIFGADPNTFQPSYDTFIKAVHPDDREMVDRVIKETLTKKTSYQLVYRIYRPDGTIRFISSQGGVNYEESDHPVSMLSTVFDITSRKLAEIDLNRAESIAHLGHWIWDIKNRRVKWSNEMYHIFGVDPQTFKPTYEAYLEMVHPDDLDLVKSAVEATFRNEKPYDVDYRIIRPDGSIRYVHSQGQVIFNQSGKPVKMLRSIQDITGRKMIEIRLQELKDQAELYIDIMAHDINNLNQLILSNLEILSNDPSLSSEQLQPVKASLDAVEGSVCIIDSVRKLQRISDIALPLERVDIAEIIGECIQEAPKDHNKHVTIQFDPQTSMIVRGTGLLKEVFCNLINNSIKYSGDTVTIDINMEHILQGNKKYCKTTITDNGHGIPEEVKPKLFHRFVRGTVRAQGKGLGLYIVRMLVEKCGGSVSVENRVPGDYTKGSKFTVMLPAYEG